MLMHSTIIVLVCDIIIKSSCTLYMHAVYIHMHSYSFLKKCAVYKKSLTNLALQATLLWLLTALLTNNLWQQLFHVTNYFLVS